MHSFHYYTSGNRRNGGRTAKASRALICVRTFGFVTVCGVCLLTPSAWTRNMCRLRTCRSGALGERAVQPAFGTPASAPLCCCADIAHRHRLFSSLPSSRGGLVRAAALAFAVFISPGGWRPCFQEFAVPCCSLLLSCPLYSPRYLRELRLLSCIRNRGCLSSILPMA